MNIVENEKSKFKEITYIKSEYTRLVMLAFLSASPWTHIYAYWVALLLEGTRFSDMNMAKTVQMGCQNETDNMESDLPSGLESSR